jgi:hypothetical protein
MRLAVMMSALALAGCAANADSQRGRQAEAERDLAKALAGRTAGKAQDCISLTAANGPEIIDRNRIVYRDGRRVWVNDLGGSCPGLEEDDLLVIEVHGSQLCRNDLFRANDRGSVVPGRYCRFGKFTPYTKPKS